MHARNDPCNAIPAGRYRAICPDCFPVLSRAAWPTEGPSRAPTSHEWSLIRTAIDAETGLTHRWHVHSPGCLAIRRPRLREDSLQSWRHKIEEGAYFDREKPVGGVHEIDRSWCGLEVIEQGRQGSGRRICLELVGKSDGNSDAGTRRDTRRLNASDDEPRMHRDGNGRLVSDERPDVAGRRADIVDAIMTD